jgi:hypothetical protein
MAELLCTRGWGLIVRCRSDRPTSRMAPTVVRKPRQSYLDHLLRCDASENAFLLNRLFGSWQSFGTACLGRNAIQNRLHALGLAEARLEDVIVGAQHPTQNHCIC